jgi:hypothetical protein
MTRSRHGIEGPAGKFARLAGTGLPLLRCGIEICGNGSVRFEQDEIF